MPTRTITHDELGELVTTTNGKETVTRSVMKVSAPAFDWRTTYDPDSGVNKAMLDFVLECIADHRKWWNQGVWRNFASVWLTGQERAQAPLASLVDLGIEAEPACGTAMCTAGWVAEITRPDWVIDAATWRRLKKVRMNGIISVYEDDLMVRYDDPFWPELTKPRPGSPTWEDAMDSVLVDALKQRGFAGDTHVAVTIPTYARRVLGIGDDLLDLFDGDNSYERVKAIMEEYKSCREKPDDIYFGEALDDAYARIQERENGFVA